MKWFDRIIVYPALLTTAAALSVLAYCMIRIARYLGVDMGIDL